MIVSISIFRIHEVPCDQFRIHSAVSMYKNNRRRDVGYVNTSGSLVIAGTKHGQIDWSPLFQRMIPRNNSQHLHNEPPVHRHYCRFTHRGFAREIFHVISANLVVWDCMRDTPRNRCTPVLSELAKLPESPT